MEREYRLIGHVNRWVSSGLAFDTRAAVDAGSQVARELRGIAVETVAASR